ncbi:MAG: hydantoinase B/oxoprolinase family protein [SAR324 cluster bacterium]|nr:hydantoinase B/oxoprolinase family protein [SAR324 cluster bacterium]
MNDSSFRFSIDRGGTFTDVYAEVPGESGYRIVKLLSEDPQNYSDAPREGIRRIMESVTGETFPKDSFSADRIEWIRMGTTVATNALLERKGANTVLLTTKGFRDLLQIGNQSRPKIFDLKISKLDLLYKEVIEIDERVRIIRKDEITRDSGLQIIKGTTGEKFAILTKPDLAVVRQELEAVYERGILSLAVVFLHAYAFPEHELQIGQIAREIGFEQISLSHEVMPMVKMVARGDTTTVDAYLTPHIKNYLQSFRSGFTDNLKNSQLLFMQSDGGLTDSTKFKGSNAILSGPAGGVVGYAMTMKSGQPVIGFDMGGTSTDVSRYGKDYELVHETESAGVRIQAPQMNIKTVAAGGGSRLFFRNGLFEVGPESAGAHPGPVCYRKEGYLTVTDANLVLGRLHPEYFPKIFGPNENEALDLEASREAFKKITTEINTYTRERKLPEMSLEEVALGFLRVANEVMVRPIREISVMRGYDIKEHVLACFGGAGGQHACEIARELGISKVHIHRFAGILSAYGMGLANIVVEKQEPSAFVLAGNYDDGIFKIILKNLDNLSTDAKTELLAQGYKNEQIEIKRYLNLRYQGTDTALMIPEEDLKENSDSALNNGEFRISDSSTQQQKKEGGISYFINNFRETYRREFGFELIGREIIVDDLRVRAVAKFPGLQKFPLDVDYNTLQVKDSTRCFFLNSSSAKGSWQETPIYRLENLGAGQHLQGPAIVIQNTSTILVEPGCYADITAYGDMVLSVETKTFREIRTEADPIQVSIFGNLFMSVAEQMGRTLQRTAISTNIKERLDFSCAIFDESGGLVANAPHQPVHLGAMSEAVRQQVKLQGKYLKEGDVLLTNHPIAGGSHLPDITVITPVWQNGNAIFYIASRGHHADIGGISPGSMPPFSRTLKEEGACIKTFKLVENGIFNEAGITELLQAPGKIERKTGEPAISGTRLLSDNISDLRAQVAANQRGIDLLLEMVEHFTIETVQGLPVVQAYMHHIQINAEEAVRNMLKDLSEREGLSEVDSFEASDFLDDGSEIVLKITIDRREGSAIFDFSGTSTELWGNLNAPRAVTHSAILYSLRCLIDQEIPLNQGCLNPIQVIIEEGSLLAPSENAAVVGGNVLTSQRVTDVILKAFRVCAASQGCMNNFTFGNEKFGYYETIGGGAGAGPNWHGQSGVHTHMTNTRITDPEILERRYPVLLREFSIRKKSGGLGKFSGGNGLIREVEFLEELNAAILSERRVHRPYGLNGGESGKSGLNLFFRKNGTKLFLGGKNEICAEPGDRIRIETPGGGGFGSLDSF